MSEFKCQRCGACCRWGGYVYITEEDTKKISGHLALSEFDFVNRYAQIIHRPRLNLKAAADGACIFLRGNGCAIYPVRPKQCADFPEVWRIKELESFCGGYKKTEQDTGRT